MQVLLYGDKNFPDDLNKSILLLSLNFIHQTGRLDQNISNSIISFSTTKAQLANTCCCRLVYCSFYSFVLFIFSSVSF